MSDSARDLLVRGVAAAKAGEKAEARRYLEWVLRLDADEQQQLEALYWLSEVSSDPIEKRELLEKILLSAPNNARARRKFALLTGALKADEVVDPDRMARPGGETRKVDDPRRFVCPQCGGRMTFAPDGQSLTCEFCDRQQRIKSTSPGGNHYAERDFVLALATARGHLHPVNARTFHCEGCGVEFQLPAAKMTLTCPYCLSAYVVESKEAIETFVPDAILPFEIDLQEAQIRVGTWLNEKLQDGSFKSEGLIGLYLPVWSFEVGGSLNWRGEVYKNRQWLPYNQDTPVMERRVLVPAVKNFPKELSRYDLSRLVPYDDRYLANYPAEVYQVPLADASLEARRQVYERLRGQGGETAALTIRTLGVSTAGMLVEAFSLVFLPVWVFHFEFKGKACTVFVNGQNGHVDGDKPAPSIGSFLQHLINAD